MSSQIKRTNDALDELDKLGVRMSDLIEENEKALARLDEALARVGHSGHLRRIPAHREEVGKLYRTSKSHLATLSGQSNKQRGRVNGDSGPSQ